VDADVPECAEVGGVILENLLRIVN
jgi:hypothetical protein